MFREQDIQNEAKNFEAVVTNLFFPVGREVKTKVERLPKGRFSIRCDVSFQTLPDVGNLVSLEFCRDKKQRDQYQIEAVVLNRRTHGKTETHRLTCDEEYVPILIHLIDTRGICTHLLKETEG